ncbi:DUF2066 domain-containing protein [Photobacterium sanguinicancri]|uniref:DUF2066 domain-containing protein n=1 Tax=Photobacterium sanguinicancri TaxID=875932 RepID=A0AAW7Y824_9GAMM|nr:DUF2066 domain-containing protein [Photobacterium sanguinicancri]MDO6544793.1 DUF2066 domain-containing protein [Photobacterium sanguinicancri]
MMNEFSMLRFAFFMLALLALPLNAATVNNLYQAQVVLPDTDKQSEQTARQQGLEQVLVKVSGQSQVVDNEVIRKALSSSSQYISQFGVGSLNGQQTLDMTFDRVQVHNLLAQANATVWSDQRPAVLVWLVKENNREREIVWDQTSNPLQTEMNTAANQRGVPVLMPIGDFEDITAVTVPDLWGGFVEPVANASLRYNPEAILIVRAREDGSNVSLSWQLFEQSADRLVASQVAPKEGRASGELAVATREMVNQIADQLAAKYAVQLGGESRGLFTISVANIQTTEDFFTLERMLTSLSSVASVDVQRLHGDKAMFGVNLLTTEDAFKRELLLDRRMTPLSENSYTGQDLVESDSNINVVNQEQSISDTDVSRSEQDVTTNTVIVGDGVVSPEKTTAPEDSTLTEGSVTQPRSSDVVTPSEVAVENQFYWQP